MRQGQPSPFPTLVFAAAALLAGCGGGGGGNATLNEPPTPAPTAPTPPAPPPPASEAPTPVLLSVSLAGNGQGEVLGGGIACGSNCQQSLSPGSSVSLRAQAAPGYVFDGWGGACQGLLPICQLSVTTASTVVASFVLPRALDQAVDSLIANMPANSWLRLPSTQMGDVCPTPYQGYFCTSVVSAWSGAAYDEHRDRMIVYGGGHSDSYYNNLFSFDLGAMRWERLNELGGGATGNQPGLGWTVVALETCGFYPKGVPLIPESALLAPGRTYVDPKLCASEAIRSQLDLQQPRSAHTYGKFIVDAQRDRYCYLGGDNYPSSQMDSYVAYCFDPVARRWELVAERPHRATGRGSAAVDANGRWWYLTDGNANILRYDPSSDRWTEFGNVNYEASGQGDIDLLRQHFYVLAVVGERYALRRFALDDEASLQRRPAYQELTTTATPAWMGTRPGFAYADGLDRFFAWGGGSDVHVLDPQTLSWRLIKGIGEAPGVQQGNGTFGRWRYSPKRKVFVLVNATNQDVYLFKPG